MGSGNGPGSEGGAQAWWEGGAKTQLRLQVAYHVYGEPARERRKKRRYREASCPAAAKMHAWRVMATARPRGEHGEAGKERPPSEKLGGVHESPNSSRARPQ